MKTIVYIGTSLDGFIARKDGDIEWLTTFANEEAFNSYDQLMSRIDAMVIGRGTYEKILEFAVAGAGAVVIALATVSYHGLKATRINPARSLQTE